MQEIKEVSPWDSNQTFFGTADKAAQISKLLDMLKEQDVRIDELEEQTAEVVAIAVEGSEAKGPKKK